MANTEAAADVPDEPRAISDEEWYRTVYRPTERQYTFRAIFFGCVIGSMLSAANLYTGFTIGWTYGASITAAISAWLVFRLWNQAVPGPTFTVLENNTMQTSASAAAAMASAGLVNAIPALMIMTERKLSFFELAAWLVSVAFLGVCFAIPLKRQMINHENLRFPSGIAAAETTKALYGEGEGGREKAAGLFTATGLGAILSFLRGGLELIPDTLPKVGAFIGNHSFGKLTLGVDLSLLNMGAGALIGLRTTAWMAIGATICWAGLIPWTIDHGYVIPKATSPNYFGVGVKWALWPGVTMLVVSGLVSFALKAKSIIAALKSIRSLKTAVQSEAHEDVEVPMKWFFWGLLAAIILCISTQYFIFGMNPVLTVIAILLSSVLAMVGTRAQGETDVNPIGPMGKVTQLLFAAIAPGNVPTNLMAAGITSAGSNNCGDMMQDMKTGRLLGAAPRNQFLAQIFGIIVGGFFTVIVFLKAFPIELIGTKYPAPSVQTWKATAELLSKGSQNLPPYATQAMAISAVLAIVLTLLAELGPASVKKWVPSPTGLGLSFVLPASNSYTFFVGALIAEIIAKKWPKQNDLYTIAASSGFIAGESIMGVAVALYTAMNH
ncbi:MAG TPA: OPT family oligopeptide transporter [Polyangium sp.]|nr:OPT family oligopeptide transporter [Polyangium sp.]